MGNDKTEQQVIDWLMLLDSIRKDIEQGDWDAAEQQAGVLHNELVGKSLEGKKW